MLIPIILTISDTWYFTTNRYQHKTPYIVAVIHDIGTPLAHNEAEEVAVIHDIGACIMQL